MNIAASRPGRRLFYCLALLAVTAGLAPLVRADSPAKTLINDVIYRADGTPASGTLLVSWPAFTTQEGKAVAAGTRGVKIGPTGGVSIELVPNEGATPAGTYYKVTLKLDEAVSQREIVDEDKFHDGLSKVIDGVVQCLNASAWAKAK